MAMVTLNGTPKSMERLSANRKLLKDVDQTGSCCDDGSYVPDAMVNRIISSHRFFFFKKDQVSDMQSYFSTPLGHPNG